LGRPGAVGLEGAHGVKRGSLQQGLGVTLAMRQGEELVFVRVGETERRRLIGGRSF